MLKKLCEDIYGLISISNSKDNIDAVPNSDLFLREITSVLGADINIIRRAINILKEAHKILTIEVVQEDKQNNIKRIEGYVEADFKTIQRLKNIYQKSLMDEYELQYHKRLMTHQIIKEIYSRIGSFKNTPIGQLANKAIMLEEFGHLLEKNYSEYTDSWKSKKINELFEKTENMETPSADKSNDSIATVPPAAAAPEEALPKRAVDSGEFNELSQQISPQAVQKLMNIYGVNFFFRVQLRKYNFIQLKEILDSGILRKREDLKLLKDMIKKVKENYSVDTKLSEHWEDLNSLDHAVSHYLLFSKR